MIENAQGHNKNLLFAADRRICGNYQVPAELYGQLSSDPEAATTLARRRVIAATGTWYIKLGKNDDGCILTSIHT